MPEIIRLVVIAESFHTIDLQGCIAQYCIALAIDGNIDGNGTRDMHDMIWVCRTR